MTPRKRDWKADLDKAVESVKPEFTIPGGRVKVRALPRDMSLPEKARVLGFWLESEKMNTLAPRGTCVAVYVPRWRGWVTQSDLPDSVPMPSITETGDTFFGLVKDEQSGEYKPVMLAFYAATDPTLRARRITEQRHAEEKAAKLKEKLADRKREGRFSGSRRHEYVERRNAPDRCAYCGKQRLDGDHEV